MFPMPSLFLTARPTAVPSQRLLPVRLALAAAVLIALVAAVVGGRAAPAAAQGSCQSQLTIFTTSQGQVTTRGPLTIARDSGVGGSYAGGRLDGYAIVGDQDIFLRTDTNQATIRGDFTASGATGSIELLYVGFADLNTGRATGHFFAHSGTGIFEGYRAGGTIEAQLIGPLTFQATDIGLC